MTGPSEDARSEEVRRAAFAARHAALEASSGPGAELAAGSEAQAPSRGSLGRALRGVASRARAAARGVISAARARRPLGQGGLRIAIKVPATDHAVKQTWGDWHFALALERCFVRRGHSVRVDLFCEWAATRDAPDDVVLVLRGIRPFSPNPRHVNLMWNISHPDRIEDAEYEAHDHVFVASIPHARALDTRLSVPVSPLLQCTDPELFFPDRGDDAPAHEVLFLGNSRRQLRPVVLDAIAAGLPLSVYGGEWKGLIEDRYVRATHVPNAEVRKFYSNAKVVLNDHWPAMRDIGFLSNRLFDAAACGAPIVSDPALGIAEVFGDGIRTYATVDELREIVQGILQDPEAARARALELAARVRAEHTFDARAARILEVAEALVGQPRVSPP